MWREETARTFPDWRGATLLTAEIFTGFALRSWTPLATVTLLQYAQWRLVSQVSEKLSLRNSARGIQPLSRQQILMETFIELQRVRFYSKE